jgi:hypothetical protein
MKLSTKIAASIFAIATTFGGLAQAGSELFPGISTGIPLGAPLPQGVWGVGIVTTGTRDVGVDVNVNAAAPWIIWSTPWTLAGGRVLLDTVTPYVNVDVAGTNVAKGWANTFLDAQVKWDLGKGLFGGVQAGVYLPTTSETGQDWSSFQTVGAISYLAGGKNLSATAVYGTGKEAEGVPAWFNLDLTATQKIGKWELGGVGFLSRDLDNNAGAKQNQFAIGPLVGYDFGRFSLQAKYTKTISQDNYGGDDSRFWINIIAPISLKK